MYITSPTIKVNSDLGTAFLGVLAWRNVGMSHLELGCRPTGYLRAVKALASRKALVLLMARRDLQKRVYDLAVDVGESWKGKTQVIMQLVISLFRRGQPRNLL